MSAADRLTRLLALVPWLVAHPGVTLRECAEHFGVTQTQLEDDLSLLVVSGDEVLGAGRLVDIQFWSDEDEGEQTPSDTVITVVDAQSLDRPMRLSTPEAMSLIVALRMMEQLPGVDDRAAIASAATKLERLAAPSGGGRPGAEVAADVAVDLHVAPEVRAAVDDALSEGRELAIRYADGTSGAITQRRVVPYGVVAVDGIAYVDAYCRSAGGRRTFRVDRILDAQVVEAGDTPPQATGSAGSPSVEALVDLDASSRWVVEAHRGVIVSELPGGGARARLALHDPQWAVRLVLSLGGGARVVEPVSLAESVADAARAALAAYSGR